MAFIVGESIGPYRLVEQLGQGGMATVFKAYHAALDRYVAIKALHPAFSHEPNFLARFQREAQVVAKMEHENIVPIYDYSEHEGRPYLVMKYIDGETLKGRLKRGPLDKAELSKVVDSVGAALSYAHEQGVLHRDVKPSNVLLASDGRIYLADFGLARMAEAGESTISSDVMLGTPQYISPEQASGRHDLDNGTDIYSFGILLYELVVGKVPYIADTPYSIIHDHIYAPLPMPRAIKPEISEAVERVLLKALAKERSDRFPDIFALTSAWRQAMAEPAESLVDTASVLPPDHPGMQQQEPAREDQIFSNEMQLVEPPSPSIPKDADLPEAVLVSDQQRKAPVRKRIPVGIIAGIILVIICLCVGAYALSSGARRKSRQATATAQALLSTAALQPTAQLLEKTYSEPGVQVAATAELTTGTALPAGRPALPAPIWNSLHASGIVTETGQIEAALARVEQEPMNPDAYLELAIAYGEQGIADEAQKAFKKAVELADGSADFYELAGDRVAERDAWQLAVSLYIEALNRIPGIAPDSLLNKINRTLYLAADSADIQIILAKAPVERFSPGIVDAVRARSAIYRGETVLVRGAIRRIKQQYPDSPIIHLLEAELLGQTGETEQAKGMLKKLTNAPNTPDWVNWVADYLLEKMNK